MYTNLLTEILKNDIDKYIKMISEDIIDKTMLKIKRTFINY